MTTAPDAARDASLSPGPAQLRLAELAGPVCDRYGLALAGGHALRAHGVAACTQDGLTLVAGGTEQADAGLPEVAAALAAAYRAAGGEAVERPGTPRLEQLAVRLALGGRTHSVELRKDPLGHRPVRLDLGAPALGEPEVTLPVVALEDAAALTTALLVDRGMPRDLIDVHALTGCYREGELLVLASALDADFQPAALADRLETLAEAADGRFRARGVAADAVDGLKRWALAWAQDLRLDLLETQEAADGLHDPYLEDLSAEE
ncbi:nucleotidyl transferase AbiEii/AbiGii toxin family protein [Kitasatospora aureofaciens]|uniref:nucleotidyl transferase AbiEii/AbiGii toxin family protein n=1 Tax=Kitasatospora aureofaciens TaxID=1894 RepID=UPI001C495D0B|nr:nucleotidyl transferase AbiEii/AbiGii toxin family protein [Kitasatospora aureofaciens]MBV6701819.1 nucleotidyl transferase AbiEii/AbiGii toxin family protein [Kitasatospora aureofaciens]